MHFLKLGGRKKGGRGDESLTQTQFWMSHLFLFFCEIPSRHFLPSQFFWQQHLILVRLFSQDDSFKLFNLIRQTDINHKKFLNSSRFLTNTYRLPGETLFSWFRVFDCCTVVVLNAQLWLKTVLSFCMGFLHLHLTKN